MSDIELRLGNEADFDALFDIYMAKEINPFLSFEVMDKTSFKPIFKEIRESGQLYVYGNKETIFATCIVIRHKRRANHVVTLGSLATHPEHQGKGIGTQFISALIDKLKNEGIKRIDLCAEADNPKAIHFYKKMGFQLEGILKKYFIRKDENKYIDEHIMALVFD